jgi:putative phosphoserine phosphatase/1-acylglycerol-3-phosphate O-acyltransferase
VGLRGGPKLIGVGRGTTVGIVLASPRMAREAAFFDLDRTLLRGSSGPFLSAELRAAGLLGDRSVPGLGLLNRIYDVFGESRPIMALTRRAARQAKGWSVERVQQAGAKAAQALADGIQPFAAPLFRQHREAGRLVVLATTTPYDLVKPLADVLGLDDVVATRYTVRDGTYDGSVAGEFVWGRGKREAVVEWANEHGVALADSWAYSDSYFDAPLLSAVGHPFAVNPDARLQLLALLRRWPVIHLDAPPSVPKLFGVEPQQLLHLLFRPELIRYARFDIAGVEQIPASGPAILVANHRSYFDVIALGIAIARRGRPVRMLGKKEVFDAPVLGPIARALGGIPVDRGTGSDEPLRDAARALEAGEVVAILPQGTIPRGMAFFEPELRGRWGAVKLAAMTKAPVIPGGLWGTELVWPRNSRVPLVWNVTGPPLVRIRVGSPVPLTYESADLDTQKVMRAIVDLLPPEGRVRRDPTPEELARTLPPGYTGDPEAEPVRRPGAE